MTVFAVLDAAGRRRPPATLPGHHAGRASRNKGQRYPADHRPSREHRGDEPVARRSPRRSLARVDSRALARRAASQEALALGERDLDPRRGSVLVRCGKGGRHREIGMDALQGIDTEEIIATVHARRAPMISATAGLQL